MSWRVTQVHSSWNGDVCMCEVVSSSEKGFCRAMSCHARPAAALLGFWVWRRPSGAGGGREGFAPLGRGVIGVKVFCWDQIESTNNKTPRAIGVLERKMSFLTERQPKYKK